MELDTSAPGTTSTGTPPGTTSPGTVSPPGALQDPLAQQMLASTEPARLGYVWHDGSPRVVPVWFHWDGRQMVVGTMPHAPKVEALRQRPQVSLSVDTSGFPARVLLVRGEATVELLDDVAPEYEEAARRYLGDEGAEGWLANVRGHAMARVAVTPSWAEVYDFETRYPQVFSS